MWIFKFTQNEHESENLCVCVCVCVVYQVSEEGSLSYAAQHSVRVMEDRHHLQYVSVSGPNLHCQSPLTTHTDFVFCFLQMLCSLIREHLAFSSMNFSTFFHPVLLTCPTAYMQSSGPRIYQWKQSHSLDEKSPSQPWQKWLQMIVNCTWLIRLSQPILLRPAAARMMAAKSSFSSSFFKRVFRFPRLRPELRTTLQRQNATPVY